MDTATNNLLEQIYQAFNARDIDAVLAAMAPDVDWPNSMEGVRITGHDAVREYWLHQWSVIDPAVTPEGFEQQADGDTVVQVHQVVRDLQGDIIADQTVRHVYHFEEGLIRSMHIISAPQSF